MAWRLARSTLAIWLLACWTLGALPVFASGIELVVRDIGMGHRYKPILTESGFIVPIDLAAELGAELFHSEDGYVVRHQSNERRIPTRLIDGEAYASLTVLADATRYRVSWDPTRRLLSLTPWISLGTRTVLRPQSDRSHPSSEPIPQPIPQSIAQGTPPSDIHPTPRSPLHVSDHAVPHDGDDLETSVRATIVSLPSPFVPPPHHQPLNVDEWHAFATETGLAVAHVIEGGVERYTLSAEQPLQIESALLVDPPRLVLDVFGAKPATPKTVEVASQVVQRLRARPEGDHLRIVLDLELAVSHKIHQIGPNEVQLALHRPLTQVSVEAESRGGVITFDVPASTPVRLTELVDPPRLVIDLEETALVGGPQHIQVDTGPVERVRTAQFNGEVTRVVLDLREATPLRLRADGPHLAFEYGESPAGALAYRQPDSHALHLGLLIDDVSAVSTWVLSHPDRIAIDVRGLSLDDGMEETVLTSGPVFRVRASQFDQDTVRIVADLRYHVQHRVFREGDRVVVALEQPQLTGKRITIDAGHGGFDPGAISTRNNLTESALNLDVALRLYELVQEAGAEGILTREDDTYVDLWRRSDIANGLNADIFVSIHHNAAITEGASAKGTETYVQSNVSESVRLGEAVHRSVVSALGTRDRGVRPNPGYIVLNRSEMPAVLVEIAFLTHRDDEELVMQEWFRQRAAEGIFNGLLRFFNTDSHTPKGPMHGSDDSHSIPLGGANWIPLGQTVAALLP